MDSVINFLKKKLREGYSNLTGNISALTNPQTRGTWLRGLTPQLPQQIQKPLSNLRQNIKILSNPQTADVWSKGFDNTPQGNVSQYLTNRYIKPVAQIPYNIRQVFSPKTNLVEKGYGALGTLGGIATLIPDPFQDVAMPLVDLYKGSKAYQLKNKDKKLGVFEAIQKGGIPAMTLEKPIGLGESLTTNPAGQLVGNIAELPLMIGTTHKLNKKLTGGWSKEQIEMVRRGFTPEVRNLVGQFSQIVEDTPAKKNLGKLGDYIQTLAETVFGKEAANLSNKQLKNAFDSIMQVADRGKGIREPFNIGLSIKSVREKLEKTSKIPIKKQTIPITPKGMKERQFIPTVKEAPTTVKQVAQRIKGFYTPEGNPELIQKAAYTVKTGYDVAKQRVMNEPLSAETNAIGQEIMRQAQKTKRYDEAIQMAEVLARKGTEAGQAVQAFSIWSKLTPEGMLKYAEREFLNANEKLDILTKTYRNITGKGQIKLTPEDAKVITNLMNKANSATDEVARSNFVKQTFEYIGKKLPWGVSDLLDEYRYNNMLSNPLTHLRNAFNNLQQTFITRPATLMAQGDIKGALKYEVGAASSLPDAIDNMVKTFKSGSPLGKMDITEMRPIKPKRLGFWNIPSNAMEAADQFFTTLIKGGEMARGSTADEAARIAEYSLFRQPLNPKNQGVVLNKIDDIIKGAYHLRKVGLGWFIPFIRTPMNVAKQWIEYSPAGFTTIIGAGNKKEQLTKAMLGSLATLYGANLALQDRVTWGAPTDPEQKKLFYDSGRKPYSVKIGNAWVPMQYFGVFAWAVGIPAAIKEYTQNSRTALTDDQLTKLTKIISSIAGFWSNQTFVSGLGSFIKLAEGDTDYSLSKNLGHTAGQLKPWGGLMRYVSTIIDPVFRKPRDLKEQLISDIPGLTKTLQPYTNIFGEPSTRNLSNYVAPYAIGIDNPQFEQPYQERSQTLQENAFYNKLKKDLESGTITTGTDKIKISGGGSRDLDIAKLKLKYSDQDSIQVGDRILIKSGDTIKTIDTSFQPKEPELTGNTELDKKLVSKYKGDITKKSNDILALYQAGYISKDEAAKELDDLKNKTDAINKKIGKGKKVKFAVRKAILKLPKISPVKSSGGATIKIKKISYPKVELTPKRQPLIKIKRPSIQDIVKSYQNII